jgi:hypothetical protein
MRVMLGQQLTGFPPHTYLLTNHADRQCPQKNPVRKRIRMLRHLLQNRQSLYQLIQNVRKDTIANFLIIPRDGFLDISFVKDSSLFLHAIQSPFYWRILKKPKLSTKNPQKLESIHE